MINYTDKGFGLNDAIIAAGHYAIPVNGVWHTSNDIAVQAIIDGYTLQQAKDHIKKLIDLYSASLRNALVAGISPGEMASWAIKRTEANLVGFSLNPADTKTLSDEAFHSGETVAAIALRVKANATSYLTSESFYSGRGRFHKNAVQALLTFPAVNNYNWSTGWTLV